MDCYGFREPEWHHENRNGDVFYTCFCEGCGDERNPNHESNISWEGPVFYKDCIGQCTRQRELTDYADACQRCGFEKVYLTPGTAMRRKIAAEKGEPYDQRKKYCDDCLDEVIHRVPCRNAGCGSIGGERFVEATFGEQLWYEKRKELTFPPNNCAVCRRMIKKFKSKPEIRPNCQLCKKPFRVTYGLLIIILKNENEFKIPRECVRCRGLSPADRLRVERENSLLQIKKERIAEIGRVLSQNVAELEREIARWEAAKKEKNIKAKKKLERSKRLMKKNMRAVFQKAVDKGDLVEILSNPKTSEYREIQAALAHLTGGKSAMTDREYNALPSALRDVLEDHPDAIGVFQNTLKDRAPGMSPVQQHYEILAAAALKSKEFTSLNGKKIALYSTDEPHFGIKSAQDYAQPRRGGTIEADILINQKIEAEIVINRNTGIMDKILLGEEKTIGIDTKHTLNKTYPTDMKELRRELEGITKNFNDGRLDEFFFVTNQKFGEDFKREVEKTNLELIKNYVEEHNEKFQTGEYQSSTSTEKASMPSNPVELNEFDNLEKYTPEVRDFAAKYEIKQVEICEYVNYAGT